MFLPVFVCLSVSIGSPVVRPPRGHLLNFSYHITFYNTYWIVLPDCTSFKKHRVFFYKRLIQGNKKGYPRLEHLLNFTLRYGYSLWYDQI